MMIQKLCAYVSQETCSKWWLEIWQWRVDVHDRKHDARVKDVPGGQRPSVPYPRQDMLLSYAF